MGAPTDTSPGITSVPLCSTVALWGTAGRRAAGAAPRW